jgi:hypothetical protein
MVLSRSLKKRDQTRTMTSAKAIEVARWLFKEHGFLFRNAGKLEAEFMELGLVTTQDRDSAVDDAFSQITPSDRHGPQPPDDIADPPYGGGHLFAFVWQSKEFGRTYIKFSFTGATGLDRLVLHSFHKERAKSHE